MDEAAVIELVPIYGWGWLGTPPEYTRETPSPFTIKSVCRDTNEWAGMICTADHEFHGMTVRFSQRNVEWNGIVDVSVWNGTKLAGQGWGRVPEELGI